MSTTAATRSRSRARLLASVLLGLGTIVAGVITVSAVAKTLAAMTVASTAFTLGMWVPLTVVLGMLAWMVPTAHPDAPAMGYAVMGAITALSLEHAVSAGTYLLVVNGNSGDAVTPLAALAIAAFSSATVILLSRTESPASSNTSTEKRRAIAHRAYVVLTVAAGLDLVVLAVSSLPAPGEAEAVGILPPLALGGVSAAIALIALSAASGVRHGRPGARIVALASAGALAAKVSTLLYSLVAVAGLGDQPAFTPQWIFAILSPLAIIGAIWALTLLWTPEVTQWCQDADEAATTEYGM